METGTSNNQESGEEEKMSKSLKKFLLIVNSALLATGCCVGPLVQRLYFLKGGKSVWISCFLETAGWPFIIFPLIVSYFFRRRKNSSMTKLFYITPHLFLACAVIGVLTGLDDFLAAYGVSLLPVSTYSLIIATQLGFTAAFAFILVKQKFTPFTINAIFLLTIGAVILVLHASSDRHSSYGDADGFVFLCYCILRHWDASAQGFCGFSPLCLLGIYTNISLHIYSRTSSHSSNSYSMQAIPREAREFELGKATYYLVLICTAVFWQFFFLGAIGVVFCHSSLLSGIIIAALLPVTEILAVLFYHEKFHAEKAISLGLSLWGFISYFYGEFQQNKKLRIRLQN